MKTVRHSVQIHYCEHVILRRACFWFGEKQRKVPTVRTEKNTALPRLRHQCFKVNPPVCCKRPPEARLTNHPSSYLSCTYEKLMKLFLLFDRCASAIRGISAFYSATSEHENNNKRGLPLEKIILASSFQVQSTELSTVSPIIYISGVAIVGSSPEAQHIFALPLPRLSTNQHPPQQPPPLRHSILFHNVPCLCV